MLMTAVEPAPGSRGRRYDPPIRRRPRIGDPGHPENLFEERPFPEISVDDLAKGAGLSRPTFYFYFPSKDAVLEKLLDRVIREVDRQADAALGAKDSGRSIRAGVWRGRSAHCSTAVRWAPSGDARRATRPGLTIPRWRVIVVALSPGVRIDYTTGVHRVRARVRRGARDHSRRGPCSVSKPHERANDVRLRSPMRNPAWRASGIVDTLAHIWVSSIYGRTG